MKKKIFTTWALIAIIFVSCENETTNLSTTTELEKPVVMNVYCQSNPSECWSRVEYQYKNGNLVLEKKINNGELYSETTFEYNLNNQLLKEIYDMILDKHEKIYIYNEANQLVKIKNTTIHYHSDGQIETQSESEVTFEYENNLLVKETTYWGGAVTYEYDNNGRVITKIDYTKMGEKHHITHYEYTDNLKTEEWTETNLENIIYRHKFQYDSKNRLIKVTEDDKTIEENMYEGNRLTEKREYYFGIDPGYFFCSGNYIYQYEY
jgi:hypothetical protein